MQVHATSHPSEPNVTAVPSADRWYAAHVRVNQEKVVASHLAAREIEGHVPAYQLKRNWSDRVKELELPLFPGYVFFRADSEKRAKVVLVPGVIRIVGSGRKPTPIDDSEMEALRVLAESDIPRQPFASLAVGDPVEIRGGPLAGVNGTLAKVMGGRKLIVSITLLQRSVAVEFDNRWVTVAR